MTIMNFQEAEFKTSQREGGRKAHENIKGLSHGVNFSLTFLLLLAILSQQRGEICNLRIYLVL